MLSEKSIMADAEAESRRLGHVAIAASNESWKLDELIREVRHAYGAAKQDALARLSALLASYAASRLASAVPASRFRQGVKAIGRTLAGGTVGGLALIGFVFVTSPDASSAQNCRVLSSAGAGEQLAQLTDALQRALDAQAGQPDRVELVRPVWRR